MVINSIGGIIKQMTFCLNSSLSRKGHGRQTMKETDSLIKTLGCDKDVNIEIFFFKFGFVRIIKLHVYNKKTGGGGGIKKQKYDLSSNEADLEGKKMMK